MKPHIQTTILVTLSVVIILLCVWGLKSLYFDVDFDQITLKTSQESTEKLSLPKLLIHTLKAPESTSSQSDMAITNPTTNTNSTNTGSTNDSTNPADGDTKKEFPENDLVMRVILQHKNRLQRCYENHLRQQPDSQGEMLLELNISAHGRAQNVRVEKSDFNDPVFSSCISSVIERLQFKTLGENPFLISIPLEFQ